MDYTFKKISEDKNKTEIEVKVDFKEFEKAKEKSLAILGKDVKIEGFRPGKAPQNLIEAKLGSKLVTESIGRLMLDVAYDIIEKEDFKPVKQPEYDLKKLDAKEGVIFSFIFTNYPKVELGDFSKIKAKREEVVVSEKDIEDVIKSVVKSGVKPERLKELTKVTEVKAAPHKHDHADHEGHDHDHTHDHKHDDIDFELNDKVIEELGYEKEKTLDDVKEAVKERLKDLKKQQAEEKYTNAVVEEAIKLSKFDLPDVFIDPEVEHSEKHFTERLEDLKLDVNAYLATQGKKIEDLREDWKKQATERVSIDLVLINIAMQNDLMPSDEDIQAEIDLITDPSQKHQYDNDGGREYIRTVLARRKGLVKLMETVEAKK